MVSALYNSVTDFAVEISRSHMAQRTNPAIPPQVQHLTRFTRLPAKARSIVVETLTSDEEFRRLIQAPATEARVGRLGMLLLDQPAGWREKSEELIAALEEPVIQTKAEPKVQQAQKTGPNTATGAHVKAQLAESEAKVANLAGLLDQASRERQVLQERLEQAEARSLELTAERKQAVSELKHLEGVLAKHVARGKELQQKLDSMSTVPAPTAGRPSISEIDLRDGVARTRSQLRLVETALQELEQLGTAPAFITKEREPLRLPGGMFDDGTEAAEFLVSTPSMVVLVDGYNVTKEAHSSLDLDLQRTWLEKSLSALSSRSAAKFHIVFDGSAISGRGGRQGPVEVSFSPDEVEADDVLIEMVGRSDPDQAITVVSSDNRVRAGCASLGANLLYSKQLIPLLK